MRSLRNSGGSRYLGLNHAKLCFDARFTYLDLVCFTARHGLPMGLLEESPEIKELMAKLGKAMEKNFGLTVQEREQNRGNVPCKEVCGTG